MLPARFLLLVGVSVYVADPGDPLRVLRATPSSDAGPASIVTVSFDRPVAGSLDRTVDPAQIFSISPRVQGRLEWRDPITLRFTPASLLVPGTSYTVTLAPTFEAMDGSRLEGPYEYSFKVRGPQVLTSSVSRGDSRFFPPNAKFSLVLSARVEPQMVERSVFVEFAATCPVRTVRTRVTGQREIREDDGWEFREAGGWERNRSVDSLRRVVELEPVAPLPRGCSGELVTPLRLDQEATDTELRRFSFATFGDFWMKEAGCPWDDCPTGPVQVSFTTPVRGSEVMRWIRLQPAASFTVNDSLEERANWILDVQLEPRKGYAVIADTGLRDIFGQRLVCGPSHPRCDGNVPKAVAFFTPGYAPTVDYTYGKLVVEREGYRTLAVRHVNVDTLVALIAPVPDSLAAAFLARSEWGWDDLWPRVSQTAVTRKFPVRNEQDHARIFGIPLPLSNAQRPGSPTLLAVRISSPNLPVAEGAERNLGPLALIQVTDLGVHARIGVQEGLVWVTGASDGKARAGARIELRNLKGRVLASGVTDSMGLVHLRGYQAAPVPEQSEDGMGSNLEAIVVASYGPDRAVTAINQYDPDLSPWRFNVWSAWQQERVPMAGTVFTERGIYRPGEPVYAKAIIRRGALGSLRTPVRGDSLRWTFHDREGGTLLTRTVAISRFGTADQVYRLPTDVALGDYTVAVQFKWQNKWLELATAMYRVAEYRPPEFLVGVTADSGPYYAGDKLKAAIEARYLFGAQMARAAVGWTARMSPAGGWETNIPGLSEYYVGDTGYWWEEGSNQPGVTVLASGTDTLDAAGRFQVELPLNAALNGKTARATVQAVVTDVNRQAVGNAVSVLVHPADFYLGAKPLGTDYFWQAGTPQRIAVLAADPGGRVISGVKVEGAIVRREWHRVHRERAGMAEQVGEWVMDTVGACNVTTGSAPVSCPFTPDKGGIYVITLRAKDSKDRPVTTSFSRWASGSDWVPWNDENQFKMDVVADRNRYSVGDTATVLFASPFTDTEAWITVEREGLIEQRRLRLTSGSTTLKFPITEAFAPNAYVSILVARGRSAKPGPLDDPGRPTIRVGYAQLRVTPEVKRLEIAVEPGKPEYRPGDTATVRLRVRDGKGGGQRSEVTLWAVDEGVLALTGYQTPDPLDLIYRERGLGLRLASNMVSVAPQVPEGEKGRRAPGGGGGAEGTDILRSRFQTTAFFLGSVVTDSLGVATARAKLPDNLTTFRVMAVAVTAGDRYGHGQSSMLVTRPLLARPALPRFLRAGDEFAAGVVVNQRAGGTPMVTVKAEVTGVNLVGPATRQATLEAGRGREVRFDFMGLRGDTARLRFDVTGAGDADAVLSRLPVKEAFRPRFHTVAGVLIDSATAEFTLPGDIDPDRSQLEISLGGSPLGMIRGAFRSLRVYPYYCTEQVSSSAMPLIALYRAAQRIRDSSLAPATAKADIELAVATLSRRQRPDGGIGFWNASDWTTPWLSAYAGIVLLEARAAGIRVSDSVLSRLGTYLSETLANQGPVYSPVAHWYDDRALTLAEQVAAVDMLSRLRVPDVATENELLRQVAQLDWEDRVRLAEVLSRRRDKRVARELLTRALEPVKVEGRTAVIPDSLNRHFYFQSSVRPTAQLLTAVLAIDSSHAIIGPLVERLVQTGRVARPYEWNTQDFGSAVYALAAFERRQRRASARGITVVSGTRQLLRVDSLGGLRDSTARLSNLLTGNGSNKTLRLNLAAGSRGLPVYYYLTVKEIPLNQPVRPDDTGISVERWYESYGGGKPITEVNEGDLVRVRLRITVPASRHFVVLDDALPAGLEAIDLSLRTTAPPGVGLTEPELAAEEQVRDESVEEGPGYHWYYGSWDSGWWSPFDHKELRDDRVVYSATILWRGTYTVTYVARATTPGVFVRPPAHAEEMYNPGVHGRSDGGIFTVKARSR
jgi:uncharacterized protein YfaS (alpha-2-macroglobulin family)